MVAFLFAISFSTAVSAAKIEGRVTCDGSGAIGGVLPAFSARLVRTERKCPVARRLKRAR
jgi:hypothetical protein